MSTIRNQSTNVSILKLLSEQNQNVLIWSAYERNKIGTFLFAPNCPGIKTERFFLMIAKQNQNVSNCAKVFKDKIKLLISSKKF
jgi:hypothetical protein